MKKILICFATALFILPANAVKVGEKVVLDAPATGTYATGERIRDAYKGKTYTVRQVGTKKYPNAILLQEISSWVPEEYLRSLSSDSNSGLSTVKIPKTGAQSAPVVKADTIVKVVKETVTKLEKDTIIKVQKDTVVLHDTVFVAGSSSALLTSEDSLNQAKGFNRVSLGLRGGAAAYMTESKSYKWNVGNQAAFDFQYAHYFNRKNIDSPYCGILTGISASYLASSVKGSLNDAYSTKDAAGDQIDYTITAKSVSSNMNELQLQVPLMFSLLYKGLYFNVGPRFVVPVYSKGYQSLSDAHITACYVKEGVTLTDEIITGKLSDNQLEGETSWKSPMFQINASAEIGYEFALNNGDSFGVGVYADYGVFNLFKGQSSAKSMINISQVGANAQSPAPSVDVLPLVSTYASKLGYFDAGIRLIYHFNLK